MSKKEIVEYLKNTLSILSPQLAKEKFGIKWLDNNLLTAHKQNLFSRLQLSGLESRKILEYPTLVICDMGLDNGFGVFTLVDIKAWDIIADNTGKRIKDPKLYNFNPYIVNLSNGKDFEKIDASKHGDVAIFFKKLIMKDELLSYGYEFTHGTIYKNFFDIATANCGNILTSVAKDKHSAIMAIKDIYTFQQLGIYYKADDGYEYPFAQNI